MRTTVDIPEDLLEEARRPAHLRTRRAAIIAGLQELIRKARREELRSLAGRVSLDVYIPHARRRKTAHPRP